ncbi:MAG: hypothetical protein K6E96_09855 [Bacteroidales bacterium]|nr:hypothetical protein [Bacteroidales bacterium]
MISKKIVVLAVLAFLGGLELHSTVAQTTDSSRLALHLDGTLFFVDNEYTGNRLDGYTLPGFTLRPTVEWRLDRRVTLQGGLNWIHYWGNTGFPQGPLNEVRPIASDTLSPLHLLPWLQARFDLSPGLCLVIGSLVNTDGHGLPYPLYNPERLYAVDPEAGAQLLLDYRYLTADLWVDWRRFIWYSSPWQEIINGGLTLVPRLALGENWEVALPLHAVVQHRGGEGLYDSTQSHYNFVNAAAGIRVSHTSGDLRLTAEANALHYSRSGASEGQLVYDEWGCLRSEPLNFKRGWGASARMGAAWRGADVDVAYWVGERFVPILGSYHYSNISSNTPSMTHDRIQVLTASGRYCWQFSGCDLEAQGTLYHYFAYTADRKGYWKCYCPAETMFALGLLVRLHPTISLVK